MARSIFLAGGSGAAGRRLVPLLARAGHHVVSTTRDQNKAAELRALGAAPAIVDVYDLASRMPCRWRRPTW